VECVIIAMFDPSLDLLPCKCFINSYGFDMLNHKWILSVKIILHSTSQPVAREFDCNSSTKRRVLIV